MFSNITSMLLLLIFPYLLTSIAEFILIFVTSRHTNNEVDNPNPKTSLTVFKGIYLIVVVIGLSVSKNREFFDWLYAYTRATRVILLVVIAASCLASVISHMIIDQYRIAQNRLADDELVNKARLDDTRDS